MCISACGGPGQPALLACVLGHHPPVHLSLLAFLPVETISFQSTLSQLSVFLTTFFLSLCDPVSVCRGVTAGWASWHSRAAAGCGMQSQVLTSLCPLRAEVLQLAGLLNDAGLLPGVACSPERLRGLQLKHQWFEGAGADDLMYL